RRRADDRSQGRTQGRPGDRDRSLQGSAPGQGRRPGPDREGRREEGPPQARMTTSELFRVSSAALTRHKLRAFLTLLGVIIGVATVGGVVSGISGLNTSL